MEATDRPDLSVVVTVVEGIPALTLCLEALRRQVDPPVLEIIVPYDDTIAEIGLLSERFPEVRFISLGSLTESARPKNAFTEHVLYDCRRAGGLRVTTGRLVAMLEDRGRPQPQWTRAMVTIHDSTTYAAIGGAIENGAEGNFRWALFFCDFGRFQPPIGSHEPEYLSDINICYKREALESVRYLWNDRYQEAAVNWALRRLGHRLHLSDSPVVVQERKQVSVMFLLQERICWGRNFAHVRGRETSPLGCILWAASTPILPVLLFTRHLRRELMKRQRVRRFISAVPATLLLLHFWVLGEFIGYCEAATFSRNLAKAK